MIDLKGERKEHINLIKTEEGINKLNQNSSDAEKRTIYAVNEFKELISNFNKFRYHIGSQNELLKSQDGFVRNKEFAEAKSNAEKIKADFIEERKFYEFLRRKEKDDRIKMLNVFKEVIDIGLLGNILARMARTAQRNKEVREELNAEYTQLEKLRKDLGKNASKEIMDKIDGFETRITDRLRVLQEENERMMGTEELINRVQDRIKAVKEQKAGVAGEKEVDTRRVLRDEEKQVEKIESKSETIGRYQRTDKGKFDYFSKYVQRVLKKH
jgi:hypothetical protein